MFAFTTRIPLAVMIAMGIRQWENRSAMPEPRCGQCGMSCSKSSDEREYMNLLVWAKQFFPAEIFQKLPVWDAVSVWRGKLIAVCDYEVSYTPGDAVWNEGYLIWWHLTNVSLLKEPIPCRGSVEMWQLLKGIFDVHTEQLPNLFEPQNEGNFK